MNGIEINDKVFEEYSRIRIMNRSEHDQFHIDLLAVAANGCRLQVDDRSSTPSKGNLIRAIQKYQAQSSSLIGQSQPAVTDINSQQTVGSVDPLAALDSSDLPRRYVAALKTFAMTSQMTHVLEGLSVRYLAQEQLRRILYWPTIYLLLLLAVGSYGMLLFYEKVVPLITDFRRDGEPVNQIEYQQIDFEKWTPFLAYALIGLGLFAIVFLLFGGATQLVRWLGGKKYVDELRNSACLRCVPTLLAAGLSKENAVKLSCDLSGITEEAKQKILPNLPGDNPGYWQIAADFWSVSARSRLARLKFIVPMLLVLVFGGLFSVGYCVALFGPLFTAISKLSQ